VDGWQESLQAWGVDLVVIQASDGPGFGARLQREGWRELYSDADGIILAPGTE
jgi:hypothetical protein